MKNISVEELQQLLLSEEIGGFQDEIKKLVQQLDVEPFELAAALLKKVNDTVPYHKREKTGFKPNPNAQRFFINVGSLEELNNELLIKFIIERVPGIERDDFSDVYIRDRYSFFELPKERSNDVLEGLKGSTLKERNVRVELSERRNRKQEN